LKLHVPFIAPYAIVLMPGPYDSRDKKVNEVKTYDVFGSHT
jgi:hypothetical protein